MHKPIASLIAVGLLVLAACEVADSDSRVLELTFDGEQCSYEGPSMLSAGEVEIVYHNESAEDGWFDFVTLDEGRTIQELLDYIADPRSPEGDPLQQGSLSSAFRAPSWIVGVWSQPFISANGSSIPTMLTLQPGLHALVCGTWTPYVGYFGSELTVTP